MIPIQRFTTLAFVTVALALSACSSITPRSSVEAASQSKLALPQPLTNFVLTGRFSLRTEQTSHSGLIQWSHSQKSDTVLLSSPLGQGIAEITTSALGATLSAANGKTYQEDTPDALTTKLLGYPLPIDDLSLWLQGRQTIEAHDKSSLDSQGRLQQFQHEDWFIRYKYPDFAEDSLPQLIDIEKTGNFKLRIVTDNWHNNPQRTDQ